MSESGAEVAVEPTERVFAATGHSRVDSAVARLDDLPVLPTSEHAEVFEDVHRRLHEALADLDGE